MRHNDFRRFLAALDKLNPAQVADAQSKLRTVRRRTEAISEIEARTTEDPKCPFCSGSQRQKWGRTRTKVQRYRCSSCRKTYSGRTGSAIGHIHRPDLFLTVMRDMLESWRPRSIRRLARHLGLNKHTVWRWRMLILSALPGDPTGIFAGIVEADETFQKESRKGSREWVRYFRDPENWPEPPRLRWSDYRAMGIKLERGLSKWQLPILTVADRSGSRCFQRLPNRRTTTIVKALAPLIPADAVLCSDGASAYATFAERIGITHFVLGSRPGTRMASPSHHIQNVNSLHARYDDFLQPFCGPATKYLNAYINWFVARTTPDLRNPVALFGRL